jgi:hypothetical protein
MAITPESPGTIDTPNALSPETAGSVAIPNTLTPESEGSVSVPNTLTPESAGSIAVPNTLTPESAGSVAVPNTLTAESTGSVSVPNSLSAASAGSVAVPNSLTSSDAIALPRTLTPTVDINYAANLFAQNGAPVTESSLITFARASTGTFINRQLGSTGRWEYFLDTALSGVQRIEYDAATGENLGALIEQASTNLCLRSEQFDDASWVNINSTVTANDTTAPDLTTSADKIEAATTATNAPLVFSQSVTVTPASSYTMSAFVKRSEASFLQITPDTSQVSGNPRVNFDLSNGTIGSQDAGFTAASITPIGSDWFRVSATCLASAVSLRLNFILIKSATDGRIVSNSWTAGDGLYIWGAQIEQAAIPTSYIPTTTAAVSRLADQASIPVAGNVPSGDVSFYTDADYIGLESAAIRLYYIDGSGGGADWRASISNFGALSASVGSTSVEYVASGSLPSSFEMVSILDKQENTLSGYIDGVFANSGDAGALGTPDSAGVVGIGNNSPVGTQQLNGHIKRFTIYDIALTAAEAAQL